MHSLNLSLWAVHISDGFLSLDWMVAGFIAAGVLAGGAYLIDFLLAYFTKRELREEEIAHIAVLTAAFFLASQIHIRIGPTTVHLLLNGLLGVVLRWRAALAIPVGLFLQMVLFQHGGYYTLGINSCVMVIPALTAWLLFAGICRMPWLTSAWFRGLLVCLCGLVLMLSATYSFALIASNNLLDLDAIDLSTANAMTLHPLTLALSVVAGLVFAGLEPRLENAPEFPLGLLVGMFTVLFTMLLNCLVLIYGGAENWRTVALFSFAAHMPIAVIEGFILGGVVGFLVKVKPSMLGWRAGVKYESQDEPSAQKNTAEEDPVLAIEVKGQAGED